MTDHEEIPRAILEWLNGLDAPPIVRAMGRSAEESAKILKFLERLLKADASE